MTVSPITSLITSGVRDRPHVAPTGARQRVEGHEALVAPADVRVGRCDVERRVHRLLHRLDAVQHLLGEEARAEAERGERCRVPDRSPQRFVTGEYARQTLRDTCRRPCARRRRAPTSRRRYRVRTRWTSPATLATPRVVGRRRACAARRTRQMFAAARPAAAGATIAYDRPRLAPLRSNVSCSTPTIAPAMPLVASMNPLVRAPARWSGSRWRCGSAFCNTRPAPIAARSAAIDVEPQRPSWTRRRRAWPPATSAAAWIDSWMRLTNAWFAAADRPVTSAWSIVERGMSVRWNVSGALVAAYRSPAWSARPASDWCRPFAIVLLLR